MYSIAIIDDEDDIREILQIHLSKTGYEVNTFPDGKLFFEFLNTKIPNVVILDIMMDKINGYQILAELRKKYPQVGVIFLTAKTQISDKVLGLDLGADDYITKPFEKDEILSRVKSLLRRKANHLKSDKKSTIKIYQYKSLIFDKELLLLTIDNKNIKLTKTEYLLLELFTSLPRKIFKRDEILDYIWDDSVVNERTIDVHIKRLRHKIEPYQEIIQTHSGLGYSIEAPES